MKNLELKKFVAKVKKFNKANNSLPILDNFLIKNGKLSANNLEIQFSKRFEDLNSDLFGLINILYLEQIVKKNKNPEIDLNTLGIIKAGKNEFKYNPDQDAAKDFPEFNVSGFEAIGAFNEQNVKDLKTAVNFAGKDELRPVMSGVNIDKHNICATDAHLLYRTSHGQRIQESFIMPAMVVNLMDKPLYDIFNIDYQNMFITHNNEETIYFRAIEGKYPNYEAVIPKENTTQLFVEKSSFLETISLAEIAANKVTKQICLELSKDKKQVTSFDNDFKTGYSGEIDNPGFEGNELKIGFNSGLLQKLIKFVDSKELKFDMSLPNRAAIVNNDFLIMPVMLT